ncbi:MAG: TadE/TadG family type IV pilus assembly protein [Hyphomonadaceae bacterium]
MPFAFAERRFARNRDGAAAVEFAMISPALFSIVVGVLMLGVAYYEGATIQWSLERSLRSAMIHPDVTLADIEELMADDLVRIGSPEVDFSYVVDDTGAVPLAIVTADYDVPLEIPFLPPFPLHFRAETVAPVPAD